MPRITFMSATTSVSDRRGMSSRAPAPRFAFLRSRLASVVPHGSAALLLAAVLALATGLLAYIPSAFSVDSWLALATGPDIWQHGRPFHELLRVVSHAVLLADQQ